MTYRIIILLAAFFLLGGWLRGSITTSGAAPVVTVQTLSTFSPASSSQAVGTLAASGSPTSWAISSCSGCAGFFAIDNSGDVTITPTGAASLTANNTSALVTNNLVVTASNGAGASNNATIPINVYADGFASAPSCGSPQHANLLNSYGGTGARTKTNPLFQPPWNVAGVDYCVGASSATGNPATFSATGVSVNTSTCQFTISGSGVTVSGLNFGAGTGFPCAGAWQVVITGANDIFTNNAMQADASFTFGTELIHVTPAASNVTITGNTIDGGGNPTQGASQPFTESNVYASLIAVDGTGTCTAQYNWLKNAPSTSVTDVDNGCSFMYDYNMIENASLVPDQHKNFMQYDTIAGGSTTLVSPTVIYNTGFQNTNGANGQGTVGEFWQMDSQICGSCSTGLVITDAEVGRTVGISLPTSAGSSSSAIISGHEQSGGSNTGINIHDNYVDPSGSLATFAFDAASASLTVAVCTNTLNMNTGTRVTGTVGAATCN